MKRTIRINAGHGRVEFTTNMKMTDFPDGQYIVPSTLEKDAKEFEPWHSRFLLCRAALVGAGVSCGGAFLEIVVVDGATETWEYGT